MQSAASLRAAPSIVGARVPASNRAVKVAARPKAVKVAAFYDPDQYDHDANSGRGSGFVATRAAVPSSNASGGARPTRVTRGADGVVYDPDQFDPDANQRSGGAAVRPAGATAQASVGSNTKNPRFALLFDCDGVIVETEELHRKAYNASFKHFGLVIPGKGKVEWSVEYYDVLANTVGGGKPKMRYHFDNNGWPSFFGGSKVPRTDEEKTKMVDSLQDMKTEFYKDIVESQAIARPGVLRLIDEAIAAPDIAVGICSAATKEGFLKVVNSIVGPDRLSRLDVVMAGDDVTKKKPDPLIYNLAREKVGLPSSKCVVIEDSLVGLRAAMGANMPCVITPCPSSDVPDFRAHGARAVMDVNVGLGDGAGAMVTLAKLFPANAAEPNFDFGGGYGAGYGSSSGGVAGGAGSYSVSAPERVTRGADGVVYDPDQFDPDANQRSR